MLRFAPVVIRLAQSTPYEGTLRVTPCCPCATFIHVGPVGKPRPSLHHHRTAGAEEHLTAFSCCPRMS
eukprot:scaffold146542_cov36-Tisochrysis_lutea.AAC.1